MSVRMLQDQPTQAVTEDQGSSMAPGKQGQPQPTHHCPSAGLGVSWGPHGRHSPKACGQEGAGKDSLTQVAPTVLLHIPAKPLWPPLSTYTPGSLPRPSSSLHSPRLWAGFPPGKMALPKYIFLHEDPPTIPGWRRGGGSLHPSVQGHWKAPVIPPQTSIFHCVFPGRFDAQHSKGLGKQYLSWWELI